jgi:hypothetical protein
MSLARLVVTAVRLEGRPKAQVARDYGVSRGRGVPISAFIRQAALQVARPVARGTGWSTAPVTVGTGETVPPRYGAIISVRPPTLARGTAGGPEVLISRQR